MVRLRAGGRRSRRRTLQMDAGPREGACPARGVPVGPCLRDVPRRAEVDLWVPPRALKVVRRHKEQVRLRSVASAMPRPEQSLVEEQREAVVVLASRRLDAPVELDLRNEERAGSRGSCARGVRGPELHLECQHVHPRLKHTPRCRVNRHSRGDVGRFARALRQLIHVDARPAQQRVQLACAERRPGQRGVEQAPAPARLREQRGHSLAVAPSAQSAPHQGGVQRQKPLRHSPRPEQPCRQKLSLSDSSHAAPRNPA